MHLDFIVSLLVHNQLLCSPLLTQMGFDTNTIQYNQTQTVAFKSTPSINNSESVNKKSTKLHKDILTYPYLAGLFYWNALSTHYLAVPNKLKTLCKLSMQTTVVVSPSVNVLIIAQHSVNMFLECDNDCCVYLHTTVSRLVTTAAAWLKVLTKVSAHKYMHTKISIFL